MLILAIVEHVKAGRVFRRFGTRDRDLSDVSVPDAARVNTKPTRIRRRVMRRKLEWLVGRSRPAGSLQLSWRTRSGTDMVAISHTWSGSMRW